MQCSAVECTILILISHHSLVQFNNDPIGCSLVNKDSEWVSEMDEDDTSSSSINSIQFILFYSIHTSSIVNNYRNIQYNAWYSVN